MMDSEEDFENLQKSNHAKAKFLLKSFPPFYSNTIENIRAKDYGYDDVAKNIFLKSNEADATNPMKELKKTL